MHLSVPADSAWAELAKLEKDRVLLSDVSGVLAWDERTYLPRLGMRERGEQLALLARLQHERLTSPRLAELLAQLEAETQPTGEGEIRLAAVREIRRLQSRAVKMPARLVEELSRAVSAGQGAWEDARKANRFAEFLPHLVRLIDLKREEADVIGFPREPYDALLDEFEPGLTTSEAEEVLTGLKRELVPLVQAIQAAGAKPPVEILAREYPIPAQRSFAHDAAQTIGFDFQRGRIDESSHPFCSGHGSGDVRLTTRYNERQFCESFFGILHEAGHGIYEQNLPKAWHHTALGAASSLGLHESQSRLWENLVGRGRPFWDYFFPWAQQRFPAALGSVTAEDFYAAINAVRPSFIRIEADEVTYNLHIVLRFELERELIAGRLEPAELPAAWNQRFTAMFGMTPPDEAHGCLQDIHWSAGLFGYFPTYTLGNLLAAQFMRQARSDLPNLDELFRKGDFYALRGWLNDRIHRHGSRYRAHDLVKRVCGEPLGHAAFIQYLRTKYGELYQLPAA